MMSGLDEIELLKSNSDIGLKPIYITIRKTTETNGHGHLRRLIDKLKEEGKVNVREHSRIVEIMIEFN